MQTISFQEKKKNQKATEVSHLLFLSTHPWNNMLGRDPEFLMSPLYMKAVTNEYFGS